mmetsp:Transcript_78784/g.127764  ORF Transcript_78784/g.127764 Transcript_78784/m.127764 type:complete len:139 (-) Transcript_78784:809-1225(-)
MMTVYGDASVEVRSRACFVTFTQGSTALFVFFANRRRKDLISSGAMPAGIIPIMMPYSGWGAGLFPDAVVGVMAGGTLMLLLLEVLLEPWETPLVANVFWGLSESSCAGQISFKLWQSCTNVVSWSAYPAHTWDGQGV